MFKASSTIKMNFPKIRQLSAAAVTALEMTGEKLKEEIINAQVIPFEKGNLQNESTFIDYSSADKGKVSLVHSAPYARRLYYHPEYNFSTKENPNAKGKWFEDWEKGGSKQDFAKNAYKKFYKQQGGV